MRITTAPALRLLCVLWRGPACHGRRVCPLAQLGRLGFTQGKLFAETGVLAHSEHHAQRRRGAVLALRREAVDLAFEARNSPVKGPPCLTQAARSSANAPLVMHRRTA